MKQIFILIFFLSGVLHLSAQNYSYEVELNPIEMNELGGLQSYAIGTFSGEWLIVGGRLDGLHQRQPFASFDVDGNNQDILVVNPSSKKVWRKSIASLPINIKEQLSSTNMQFYQVDEYLILTGGYGYSPSEGDHITYPFLTTIHLPTVISQIKSDEITGSGFKQIQNEDFRVAGGRLAQIDDVYHLVGGHKFMGRYNPMGPDHGPGFVQEYTNEVRKFKLSISDELEVEYLPAFHNEMHLRKRDYNLAPFILDGKQGLMAYSGVFQKDIDLPWLYPVQIGKDSYKAIEDFNQYFNHYHCATLPVYDGTGEEMNTLFFGGIAQFYLEGEVLVQDNDVPFVNTIANINMKKDGSLSETVLSTKMPGYLGAGSEFIFADDEMMVSPGILNGDLIKQDFETVGYIYGGIKSSLPNIFWINTGEESIASNTIFEVKLKKIVMSSITEAEVNTEKLFFYPNPAQNFIRMGLTMDQVSDIYIDILNEQGQKIHSQKIAKENLQKGYNQLVLDDVNIGYGAFLYNVKIGSKNITRRVVWSE